MIQLAAAFEGEHDFTAFAAADDRDEESHSKIRTIYRSEITAERGRMLFRVRGNGFLKHMVRNLVGTLLEAGKGNIEEVSVLPGKSGPTAPAKGLFLIGVEY
jgi:tRNA pseudouridine38-40 synthase